MQYLLQKDVFTVLPTGFGKSIIFQVIPIVCSLLIVVCSRIQLSKKCNDLCSQGSPLVINSHFALLEK